MQAQTDLFETRQQQVQRLASSFAGCSVVIETPARSVVRCPDHRTAIQLAAQLDFRDYFSTVLPGRKTTAFYVRTFNSH